MSMTRASSCKSIDSASSIPNDSAFSNSGASASSEASTTKVPLMQSIPLIMISITAISGVIYFFFMALLFYLSTFINIYSLLGIADATAVQIVPVCCTVGIYELQGVDARCFTAYSAVY